MRKVLIITYYWPPAGGVPVQRWVKITKYLRSFGWEPVIYTVLDGDVAVTDVELSAQVPADITVMRRPIWEPYDIYRRMLGMHKSDKIDAGFLQEKKRNGFLQKLAIRIRGNFFIPDARKFWIKPSVRFLKHYLQEHPVDAIISNGPPHSTHLIALGIKRSLHLPWIADFRDPWTGIDYYPSLHLSKAADKKHHALEKEVLCAADKVVTVSRSWAEAFNKINAHNTLVIPNGYDPVDFDQQKPALLPGFTLHHVGMINAARNPVLFWKVLHDLCNSEPGFSDDLHIQFTGRADFHVIESLRAHGLDVHLRIVDQVSHREAIRAMQASPVLLLLLNDAQDIAGRIPAKLFEYMASGRPVLSIGDTSGDAAAIIKESACGSTASMHSEEEIRNVVLDMYRRWKQNDLPAAKNINKYSRKEAAKQFAEILDSIQSTADKT